MNSPLYLCSLCSNGGIIGGADDDAGWVEHMRRTHGVHITVADLRDFRERRAQRACSLDEYAALGQAEKVET